MIESEEYYISQIAPLYGEETESQYELEERGRLQFNKDLIIDSFGSNKSRIYIDLYFDELYNKLNEQDKIEYLIKCIQALIAKYGLHILTTEIRQYQQLSQYEDNVIPLMKFLEGIKSTEFAEYYIVDAKNKKDTALEYMNKNYESIRDVIESGNTSIELPMLFTYYFKYCSGDNGIRTLLAIIESKPTLQIGVRK